MMDQQILCSDRSEVIAVEVSDAFGESRCEGLEQEISSRLMKRLRDLGPMAEAA